MVQKLSAKYSYKEVEAKWQAIWSESAIYNWQENSSRANSFIIDTPPPTVSGTLHMGHIFSYTQADFIARFQRMLGKSVFYPIGFDDNGLPTERLVEKVKKVRANSMPREEFTELCQEVVEKAEQEFEKVFRSVALSVDWRQKYQTISKQSTKLSQLSFLDLVKKNRVYRKLQPTIWDPIDVTALAQAEIVDIEMSGFMNDIEFTTAYGEKIIISTTRPELLPACVAIFCHPEDSRYKHLIGQSAIVPIVDTEVPILGDQKVDVAKGTGLVMCCTFGDITDIEWWKKYNLPLKIILNQYGKIDFLDKIGIKEEVAVEIRGLKVKEARDKILIMLGNHLLKQQPITHQVKCGERSNAPLEFLVTAQWFVKILDIKGELLEQVKKCNWNPAFMRIRLEHWVENLKWDWCISRQRFFGVPFPVWYSKKPGEEGKIIYARPEDLPVNPLVDLPFGYTREEVEPDLDVMDTWATSSISPQLNSMGINQEYFIDKERHKKLFPADLRPQAHDIIRTWSFYTIVKSYLHQNEVPWQNLMISGWCLAEDKTKMSKSKGNIITPVDLIAEKGADIVRYWASHSKLGADIVYSEDIFKLGQKLLNKLWNAAKFAELQIDKLELKPLTIAEDISSALIFKPIDLWMLGKLKQTLSRATSELNKYEYSNARNIIEDFFWNVYCDNYIEIVKTRAYNEAVQDNKGQMSAILSIYHCMKILLKLFAPFIPHISEEIYSCMFGDAIINKQGMWPNIDELSYATDYLLIGDNFINILNSIRRIKSEKQLSISAPIKQLLIYNHKQQIDVKEIEDDLANVTKAVQVSVSNVEDMLYTEDELFKIHLSF